jgi:hypothetical protein
LLHYNAKNKIIYVAWRNLLIICVASWCRPPNTIKDVETQVNKFLDGLPSTTIICASFFGHAYASLLKKLLSHPTSVETWMLVSRRSVQTEPVVMLLPFNSIVEGMYFI